MQAFDKKKAMGLEKSKNISIVDDKMSISLCMIVKNEEQYIEQCLNSVKDLVDEFIIVDTGSEDKTIDIIKKLNLNNLKIIDYKWENDFSKARNISLKNTAKDWILVMDADETISKKDHGQIRELIKKENTAYFLIQRNYTNNASVLGWVSGKDDLYEESRNFSGWLPNPIIRLFQNKKEIYFVDPVHEHVGESIKKMNGKVEHTNIPIHHFYQLKKKNERKKKGKMYLEIGEKKLGKDPKFFYEIGVQHQDLGEFEKATEYFKKAIKIDPKYIKAYVNLGANLINLNKIEYAKKVLIAAQKIEQNNAEIYNNLGIVFSKKGEYEAAGLLFRKAIELKQDYANAYFNLGLVFDKLKMYNNARYNFEKAISLNPEYKKKVRL